MLANECERGSELEDDTYDTVSEDESEENDSEDVTDDESDEVFTAINKLKETWKSLSPPINETDIIGKWYGLSWTTKRSNTLFVGKLVRRFLVDENGPVRFGYYALFKTKSWLRNHFRRHTLTPTT